MKPTNLFFIEGIAFDLCMTLWGVLALGRAEGNLVLILIQNRYLMMLAFVISNLVFVAAVYWMKPVIDADGRFGHFPDSLVVMVGAWRIWCGLTWVIR